MKKPLPAPNRGFTLIELMVVIAIIAILSVVGVSLYSNAQKRTRDSVRMLDISNLGKAIEISKTGKPPSAGYVYTQADFNSDFPSNKPKDPLRNSADQQYCIATSDTARPDNPSDWGTTSCPASPAGYSVAVDNNGSWPADTPSGPLVGSGKKYWKLCARSESNMGNYFCSTSLSP